LIFGVTVRAFALHVAIGEEHLFDRIEELLDRLHVDQARFLELQVDVGRQLGVFRRMRRVPVIERNMKTLQIFRTICGDALDELLGCDAFCFGLEHDRRAVRVVSADEMHAMTRHALKPHPDIGLDVFHDVPDVKRAVGVGKCGRDEKMAWHRIRSGRVKRAGIMPWGHSKLARWPSSLLAKGESGLALHRCGRALARQRRIGMNSDLHGLGGFAGPNLFRHAPPVSRCLSPARTSPC
jgi:hypothetical protein